VGQGSLHEVHCRHTPTYLPSPIERDACKRREAATVFTVDTTALHCFTDAMVDFLFVKPDGQTSSPLSPFLVHISSHPRMLYMFNPKCKDLYPLDLP
jgi:hypothetical protein